MVLVASHFFLNIMLCNIRLLMGLSDDWQHKYIFLFGEKWTYADALAGKTLEGHLESGPQVILQTYIQMQTSWPSIQPLFGDKIKGYYFKTEKPGIQNPCA